MKSPDCRESIHLRREKKDHLSFLRAFHSTSLQVLFQSLLGLNFLHSSLVIFASLYFLTATSRAVGTDRRWSTVDDRTWNARGGGMRFSFCCSRLWSSSFLRSRSCRSRLRSSDSIRLIRACVAFNSGSDADGTQTDDEGGFCGGMVNTVGSGNGVGTLVNRNGGDASEGSGIQSNIAADSRYSGDASARCSVVADSASVSGCIGISNISCNLNLRRSIGVIGGLNVKA